MSATIRTPETEHIQTIVEKPLNRLRIEFSRVFMKSEVSQSYFEQLLPRIKEFFSDKQLYDKHLENLDSVLSTGDIKFPINLSQEESQFFWGVVLAYISNNPEIQKNWNHKNQFTKISQSTLWKRIASSSEMRKEFKGTAFILRNSLRNSHVRMLWSEPLGSGYPNIGYCFIPENNIIIDDMLWSLVAGVKNALPAINHEIAHSQGTIGVPQKINDLEQQFQDIRQQIAEADQTQKDSKEIQKLVVQAMALQQEAKLRFYIYDELENMYANRYAMNVGGNADKLALNILETCICGTGEEYLSKPESLEDFKKELTPSKQINHIKRAVRYSFFCNNGLIQNTLEDWHSIGVYPECIVAYDKDGKELPWQDSFKKLRDICDQLEKLQPSKILRLLNQNSYKKQMKEMSQKRQELSMEFFDSFVLTYVKDLIQENVQDASQQLSEQMTMEDLQKLQQQMQNVAQEVMKQNTLRELSSAFQPQSDDEQEEKQQSDEEQKQSQQQNSSGGQEGGAEQNSDEQSGEQQGSSDGQQNDAEQEQSQQQNSSGGQEGGAEQNSDEQSGEQQGSSDGQQGDAEQEQSQQQTSSGGQEGGAEQNSDEQSGEQQNGSDAQQSDAEQEQSQQQNSSGGQESSAEQGGEQQNSSGGQESSAEQGGEQQNGSDGQQSGEEQEQSQQQGNSGGQQSGAEQEQSQQQNSSGGQEGGAEQNNDEQSGEQQSSSDGQQGDAKQNQAQQQSGSGGRHSDAEQNQLQQRSGSDGQQNDNSSSLLSESKNSVNESETDKDTSQVNNQDEETKTNLNNDSATLPPSENQLPQDQQHSPDKDDNPNNAKDNPENKDDEEEKNNRTASSEPENVKDTIKKQSEDKERGLNDKPVDVTKQLDRIEGNFDSRQSDEVAKKTNRLGELLNTKRQDDTTSNGKSKPNSINSPQSGNTRQISLDEENGQRANSSQTRDGDKQSSLAGSDDATLTSGHRTNKTSDITTGREKKLGKTGHSDNVSDMLAGMGFPKARESVLVSKKELQELIEAAENIDSLAREDYRDKTESATPQEQTVEDYEEVDNPWGSPHQGGYNARPTLISREDMEQSGGNDARFYAKGDLNSYEEIIAEYKDTVIKVRQLLKKIIEQQKMEQAKKSISHKKENRMELLPTQGAATLSIEHQKSLRKKQILGDPSLSLKDFERFRTQKQQPKMLPTKDIEVPSVDVGILIDGSGSMNGAPFETALTLGCILFEAARKIPEINIYIYMMGSPRPLVIGLPETSQEDVACNLDSVRRGQGGDNDYLTPAVKRFLQDVADRKAREPKSKSGFQHIFSITDGGNCDYGHCDVNKILETLLDNNPYMTFDSFFIDEGYSNYTKGFILEKREAGCKRIGFVDNIDGIRKMPQKIYEMLAQRMKSSKLEHASTNVLLAKTIKDSLSKIKR